MVKKVLASAIIPPIVPDIKIDDMTPTKESPHSHVHCDICEHPYDKVVLFKTPPEYTYEKKKGKVKWLEGFTHLRICKKCLTIALKLLK